ncbi:hypothetical protein [Cyanobium sp. ULC082]
MGYVTFAKGLAILKHKMKEIIEEFFMHDIEAFDQVDLLAQRLFDNRLAILALSCLVRPPGRWHLGKRVNDLPGCAGLKQG